MPKLAAFPESSRNDTDSAHHDNMQEEHAAKARGERCNELFQQLCANDRGATWLDASLLCATARRSSDPCVVNFLLGRTGIIPKALSGRILFFRSQCPYSRGECMRCLFFEKGKWRWSYRFGDRGALWPAQPAYRALRLIQKTLFANNAIFEVWRKRSNDPIAEIVHPR